MYGTHQCLTRGTYYVVCSRFQTETAARGERSADYGLFITLDLPPLEAHKSQPEYDYVVYSLERLHMKDVVKVGHDAGLHAHRERSL